MTPTPRTDERANRWESIDGQWVNAEFARQLERENQTFRAAQKACEDCDAPRVDRIAELERELAAKDAHADEIYKAAVNLAAKLEADLATERDQLTANHEATRLMGKWLERERELADRLAESLDRTLQLVAESGESPPEAEIDLAAWKEARNATV